MATASWPIDEWKTIPWTQCERAVFKLQKRIFQASANTGTLDNSPLVEEPDEVKVSRPVLKPGGGGDPAAQVS